MVNIKGNKNINVGDDIIFNFNNHTQYHGIIVDKNTLPNNAIEIKLSNDLLIQQHND